MKKNIQTKRKSPKAKNKRSRSKFPALEPKYNLKSRQELYDFDYLDKLSDKEKEWKMHCSITRRDSSGNRDCPGTESYIKYDLPGKITDRRADAVLQACMLPQKVHPDPRMKPKAGLL